MRGMPEPELGDWAELRTAGELGGRLSAALLGQAGLPAQTAAADAVRNCLLYWSDCLVRREVPGATASSGEKCREPPAEVPVWVLGEAVPGLVGLAGQREAETAARVAAVQALRCDYLRRQWAPVKAALEADMEALASCLYQEPFLKELSAGMMDYLATMESPLETPEPLIRSLALLLSFCRRNSELWAAQRTFRQAQRLLLVAAKFPPFITKVGGLCLWDVLGHDGLARELVLALESEGQLTYEREYFPLQLAADVPLSDARVCVFLRQGGARFFVHELRVYLDSILPAGGAPALHVYSWDRASTLVKSLSEMLQAGPPTTKLRAQLLRDAGLGDLRAQLLRVPEPHYPDIVDRVRFLLNRYDAALAHQPASLSRLPASIFFPDR